MKKLLIVVLLILLSISFVFGGGESVTAAMGGIYYIGAPGTAPGGANPEYASLKAACDTLNKSVISDNCIFYITSDLTEPANVALGINPDPYTITFKPYIGVSPTITFTQAADAPTVGISGAWVIGTKDLTTTGQLVTTNNIIIDGSNTDGGTTRDMTVTTGATAHGNAFTLRLIGDVNRSTVKNVKVWAQQSVTYALTLTYRYDGTLAKFFTADTITIENCEITNTIKSSGQALSIATYGTPPAGTPLPSMKGIVFKNNKITGKTRGIFLNYAGSTDIIGNEINVIQTNAGFMSCGVFGFTITDTLDVQTIYNNKITLLSTANNTAGDYGIIGIQCGSRGTYNVYNNFITGFEATATAANPNFKLIGLRLATDKVISNVFYNTINMNNLAINPGTGVVLYTGIQATNGINTLKNNIIYNGEDDFKSHAIYRDGTAGNLNADYNNYYLAGTVNAKTGFWNTADAATLADWKTASGGDAHSVAKAVQFVSGTDLHLTGASLGDFDLAGIPLAEVTTDIDGETRSTVYPYMGADEGAAALKPGVTVTIPDTSAVQEASIALPIMVTDLTNLGIYSYTFTLNFDQQVIDATDASIKGTLTEPWGNVIKSDEPGQMIIAIAGSAPLAGSGVLVYVNFNIVGAAGTRTDITCSKFMFNEGSPSANVKGGSLNVVPKITITVDGNKDPFYETLTGPADGYLQVKSYAFNDNGIPTGDADLSTNIWTAWDNDWFYLYQEVRDDTVAGNATNVYEEDCLELKFDAQATDSVTNSVWDTRLTALGMGTAGVVSADSLNNVANENKQWARKIIPGGYALELAIKWSAIGHNNPERNESITPAKDNVFGLALCQHDNDGKARRQASVMWGAVMLDAVWNTPKYHGTVKFLADNKLQFIPRNNVTGKTNPIPYDGTPFYMRIDGKRDPFYAGLAGPNNGYLQVKSYAFNDNGIPTGDADLSAKVWTAWDDKWFYLYEEVKDDTLAGNATNVYEEDCIELKFDPQATDSVTNSVWDTRFTALSKREKGVVAADSLNNVADSLKQWTRTKITGGYALEMAIKWSAIKSGAETITPAKDNVFGLAICQHDNDGKAKRQASVMWGAVMLDAVWNTPKYHGTVKFLADHQLQFIPKNNVAARTNLIPYDGTPFYMRIDGKKDPFYYSLKKPDDGYLQIRSYAWNDNGKPVDDADLSAKVWTAWDDQWFYLYEEVKDDTLAGNATNVYEEDCIELKFDPQATDSVKNSVWDTRFTALSKREKGVVAADSLNNVADADKQWVRTKITGGYALEMAFKWSVVKSGTEIITPAKDNVFGMAICQHDNDGKARRQASVAWGAALLDAVWNTPKYHGTVKFLADNKLQFIPKNNVTGLSNPIPYDGRDYIRTGVEESPLLPQIFSLGQNYPNPFNPQTTINLAIPENADVEISVYNIMGQKVAEIFDGKLTAGYHKFDFSAQDLSSGIYIYKVKANHFQAVKKMTILK